MYDLGFFVFKHKTAYEMRISDWSSDVCSSELLGGRKWVKWEPVALCSIQPLIITQRLLKHIEGAHDIGLDERARAIDGTGDMTLRRQMRDHVRLEIRHQASDQPLIADVASDEAITWIIFNGRKGRQNAGIGQLVEIEHLIFCLADQVPDQRGSDDTCSSGDEEIGRAQV